MAGEQRGRHRSPQLRRQSVGRLLFAAESGACPDGRSGDVWPVGLLSSDPQSAAPDHVHLRGGAEEHIEGCRTAISDARETASVSPEA